MDAFWIIFLVLFFVFGLPIIFIVLFFERIHKPLERAKIETPREVIVKEIVMVPCTYCRGLPQYRIVLSELWSPKKSLNLRQTRFAAMGKNKKGES